MGKNKMDGEDILISAEIDLELIRDIGSPSVNEIVFWIFLYMDKLMDFVRGNNYDFSKKVEEFLRRYFEVMRELTIRNIPRTSPLTEICSICREEWEGTLARELNCGHTFHDECLLLWFSTKRFSVTFSCPFCRDEVNIIDYLEWGHMETETFRIGHHGLRSTCRACNPSSLISDL